MDGEPLVIKLQELARIIPDCTVIGDGSVEVSEIIIDSRIVKPGSLFVAIDGTEIDGHNFINSAVSSGCAAIMIEASREADFRNVKVPVVVTRNTREKGNLASKHINNCPDEKLTVFGVTGTNGKTTTTFLIREILDTLEAKCGLVGTIEYDNGAESSVAPLTTPDGSALYPMISDMVENSCSCLSMEISSHALDQKRLAGLNLDVAVMTNLSRDHLDYHKNIENYLNAKTKIIDLLNDSGVAVVNLDEPLFAELNFSGKQVFYWSTGWRTEVNKSANLYLESSDLKINGSSLKVNYLGESYEIQNSLIGWFNVENCLAALAAVIAAGFPVEKCVNAMSSVSQVPGRMECIPLPIGGVAIVDYAHTPDALEAVLESCKGLLNNGNLITVFGCGGDRDKGKRPLMGEAVARRSDYLFVTSDNPRSENPETICQEIVKGCEVESDKYIACNVIVDRKKAIEAALAKATNNDMVIVAGKGHEDYQVLADRTIKSDDKEIIKNWIRRNK